MIWGDFNIHYDKINKLSGTTDYAKHVQSVGCIQLIDKPTRCSKSEVGSFPGGATRVFAAQLDSGLLVQRRLFRRGCTQ